MLFVSRPSLREALKVLDILGVIKTRQGDGTYIAGWFARILRDPNKVKNIEQRFTLIELLEARRIIETSLATLATTGASDEVFKDSLPCGFLYPLRQAATTLSFSGPLARLARQALAQGALFSFKRFS